VYTEGNSIAQKKISDLKERVRIVNDTQNAILISIHQNFFADSRYSGAQVFYNDIPDAKEMAQSLQNSLVKYLNPGSNRQCKPSNGVYLMEHITSPGLLVECGFLSNPEEESKLRSEEYQKKLCCVIVSNLTQVRN
jgi:N-acetylmuramoyl-L-alanine amidase